MPTRNWKNEVEEFCGTLIATPSDSEHKRTLNGDTYEYCAEFPLQEDFEDVISTREEEITKYDIHHENGACFAFFSTCPYEEWSDD